jgi:hypothetical protein
MFVVILTISYLLCPVGLFVELLCVLTVCAVGGLVVLTVSVCSARMDHHYCLLFRVRVTLRLTIGQLVCLGVEPHLGLMTRYLFIYFL